MSGTVFPYSSTPRGFTGLVLLSTDGGSTVWGFPNSQVQLSDSDNISRPSLVDGTYLPHNEVPGLRSGGLSFVSPLTPDRGVDTFLLAGWGPRTDAAPLAPFVVNIIPYNGAGVIKATGLWGSRVTIAGQEAMSGAQAMNQMRVQMAVTDPDNVFGAPTLGVPTSAGVNGLGISSFENSSFTNGTAAYDKIRSYSATIDNGLARIPGVVDPVNRIGAGYQPSQPMGAVTLEQLANPANPLPGVRGLYPFSFLLPTGDRSKKLTLDLSTSRDGSSFSIVPTDFINRGQLYSLFSSNAGNSTAGNKWIFNCALA